MTTPTIRIGGYQGPASVLTAGLTAFADNLSKSAAAPRLEIVNDVTTLGDTARSLFDGIEAGGYQIGYMASGYLTRTVPELGVLDLPFSVEDRHKAYAALDGRAGALLHEAIRARTGYRVLGFWDNGFRHLTNGRHAIRRPDDCSGLVVRTLDNRIYVETMAAMGFEPVVTDVRELKQAVASGAVDAQENPLTNSVLFGLHKHHGHTTLTGHFFGIVLFVCNAAWFDGQPGELKAEIERAAAIATAHQRRLAEDEDTQALAELRKEGVEAVEPDRGAFRKACARIIERERADLPDDLVKAYLGEA